MILAEKIIFWASVVAIIYVYIGYPALVYLVSRLRPLEIKKAPIEPNVTVLITAYNEEKDIRAKLENTLRINYPSEKLEILVASDGSTDKTDKIVREFSDKNVKLFRQEGRMGKTYTQNKAVELATGEIILFSDATTAYKTDVLTQMLPNFADETIGCVAGRLVYVDNTYSNVGTGAKSYWNYETFLKESESRACSLIGASGCLYAVRRSAYRPMYSEACSDFLIATIIYRQKMRTIFEPTAFCTEETNRQTGKELQMRVRIVSQTFTDLWRNRGMLNPFRSGFFAVELFSHKVMRYAVPCFLFFVFISSAFLAFDSYFYLGIVFIQLAFYSSAFIGWLLERGGKNSGIFAIALYFVLTNISSLIGFYKFLRGERYASWETVRDAKNIDEAPASFNQTA